MSVLTRRPIVIVGLAVAIMVAGGAIAFSPWEQSTSAQVALRGVSEEDLKTAGLVLEAAPGAQAKASADEAAARARGYYSSAVVQETVLATLEGEETYAHGRLVWVVNIDPESVPGETTGGGTYRDGDVPKYFGNAFVLVLVDATTGEFLSAVKVSDGPGGTQPAEIPGQ